MDWFPLVLSFQIAAIATVVCAVIGIALAAVLANTRFPGRDLVDAFFTLPMVLPPTVLGYYMLVALGNTSAVGKAWYAVFDSPIVFSKTGIVIAATVGALPFVVKSGRAALEGVDATLIQAARTLGAGPLRAFFTVQLPLAARGIVAALMLAFAKSLGDFGVTLMIGGNMKGITRTASIAIFDAVEAQNEDAAIGLVCVLSAIAVATLYVVNKLTARRDAP